MFLQIDAKNVSFHVVALEQHEKKKKRLTETLTWVCDVSSIVPVLRWCERDTKQETTMLGLTQIDCNSFCHVLMGHLI